MTAARWQPVARACAIAFTLAVSLVACGDDDDAPAVFDIQAAEREIERYVETTYPSFDTGQVDCPPSVPVGIDVKFDCLADVGGKPVRIEVTQRDERGSHITFVPLDAVVDVVQLVADLPSLVVDKFTGEVTVACGFETVVVVAPGGTIPCSGTDVLGVSKPITVTIKDLAGSYSVNVG
jgi:hypothetical protein